jgi:hypothetical protein
MRGFAEKNETAQVCDATILNRDSMLEHKKIARSGGLV